MHDDRRGGTAAEVKPPERPETALAVPTVVEDGIAIALAEDIQAVEGDEYVGLAIGVEVPRGEGQRPAVGRAGEGLGEVAGAIVEVGVELAGEIVDDA